MWLGNSQAKPLIFKHSGIFIPNKKMHHGMLRRPIVVRGIFSLANVGTNFSRNLVNISTRNRRFKVYCYSEIKEKKSKN